MSEGSASRPVSFEVPQHPGKRWGWIFAAIWLFNLAYPVADLVTDPHPLWVRIGGVTITVLFGAFYVISLNRAFQCILTGHLSRAGRIAPAVLFAISALMTPLVLDNASAYYIFAMAAAIMLWPRTLSLLVSGGCLVWLGLILPRLSGDRWSITLAIITIVVAAMMYGVGYMQTQEAVIRRAREDLAHAAVDAERVRFSRDLHDIVGHSLTAIIVKAELARKLAERRPESVGPEVGDIERLAREALEDVRRTVAGYREVTLAGELASARAVLEAAGVSATLPQAVEEVPGELREIFGWVVREGVTNVVRHSGARLCRIRVTASSVEVLDDGRGGKGSEGNGLSGLRERVAAIGGTLEAGPASLGGFRLAVTLPQPAPDRPAQRSQGAQVPAPQPLS